MLAHDRPLMVITTIIIIIALNFHGLKISWFTEYYSSRNIVPHVATGWILTIITKKIFTINNYQEFTKFWDHENFWSYMVHLHVVVNVSCFCDSTLITTLCNTVSELDIVACMTGYYYWLLSTFNQV